MMPIADLPPMMQERVVCSIAAAARYDIPAHVLLAVAEQEGGKPGQWVRNSNGTYDVGAMQFNTHYLRDLAKYGITADHVAARGCYAYNLAAWRLRMHIRKDEGDLWTKVANYHSRTPYYNSIYRAAIERRGAKWATWLQTRFPAPATSTTGKGASTQAAPDQGARFHIAASSTPAPAAEPSQGGRSPLGGQRMTDAHSAAGVSVGVVTSPTPALPVVATHSIQPAATPAQAPQTVAQTTSVSVPYVPRAVFISR